jgi:ribosome-associated protein
LYQSGTRPLSNDEQEDDIEAADLARQIAAIASDELATEILVLDIQQLSTISDYFVIASADNVRQLRAMAETIESQLREADVRAFRREGVAESGWIVIDYDGVLVHLLTDEQRAFYRLEDVWSDANRLLVIQ